MSEQRSSEKRTFAERLKHARSTCVGDRWLKRKNPEHWCEVISTDGAGNLRLAHWNGKTTRKWYSYLASDYEHVHFAAAPAISEQDPTTSDSLLSRLQRRAMKDLEGWYMKGDPECVPVEISRPVLSALVECAEALKVFAEMDRVGDDLGELACQRGIASDMTILTSGDFRRAALALKKLEAL